MSQVAIVNLHRSRGEQLRRAAQARNTTVTALIEAFIRREIAEGVLKDELPGFDVAGYRHGARPAYVDMRFENFIFPEFEPSIAGMVANYIERAMTERGREASQRIVLSDEIALTIARKGRGIILTSELTQEEQSFRSTLSFSMALDLVRIIRREVAYANGTDA